MTGGPGQVFTAPTTSRARAHVVSAHSPLADLLVGPSIVLPAEASLAESVQALRATGSSALLVETADGVAVVTERDLLHAFAEGAPPTARVDGVATVPAVVVQASVPIVAAAALMLNERAPHLVVQLEGGACHLVTLADIAAVLLQAVDPHLWLTSLRVAFSAPAEIWLG